MPYAVRKEGDQWAIIKRDTGEVVGHSDSEEKAQASVRARLMGAHEDESGKPFSRIREALKKH